MTSALPHLPEALLLMIAIACAASVRPWRLLARGGAYDLLPPLLVFGLALPLLWWWPGVQFSPLLCLVGASLALLTLGWPLAVLLLAATAGWGVLAGVAGWGAAISAAFWHGLLPITLALAAGQLLRRAGWTHIFVYLLGRGFLVPLAASFLSALAAHHAIDRFAALGSHAAPALFLTALLDAMLTGLMVTLLVIHRPRWLATWSDRIYLRDAQAATPPPGPPAVRAPEPARSDPPAPAPSPRRSA